MLWGGPGTWVMSEDLAAPRRQLAAELPADIAYTCPPEFKVRVHKLRHTN